MMLLFSVQSRLYSGSASGSDVNGGEESTALGIRKQSLRKIKPRSYSRLLKSESEEEEEETEKDKAGSPNAAASSRQGNEQQQGNF